MNYLAVKCFISKYVGNFSDICYWSCGKGICFVWFQSFYIYSHLFSGLEYCLCWWIFHVHLNSMHILLLLDRILYTIQLGQIGWYCCSRLLYLTNFLFVLSLREKCGNLHPKLRVVYFTFQFSYYFMYFEPVIRCT